MNAIELTHVSKHYNDFSLSDINLAIPTGCITGLIGENGAGKTTTINLIMNAIKQDEGKILVLGTDTTTREFTKVKEDVGIVLDESYYPEIMNAFAVNKMMKYTYKNWNEATFESYIQKFNLPTKKIFRDFSKGMQMKLAIAVALSHDPKLLVLDEATSGLDPIVRDEILDIFSEFTRDKNHSVLISSHIISDLEKICDYIAFIHRGQLLFNEDKDALKEKFGLAHMSRDEMRDIPEKAICGFRDRGYAMEVLVNKELLTAPLQTDMPSIEDIILHMAKKGE